MICEIWQELKHSLKMSNKIYKNLKIAAMLKS